MIERYRPELLPEALRPTHAEPFPEPSTPIDKVARFPTACEEVVVNPNAISQSAHMIGNGFRVADRGSPMVGLWDDALVLACSPMVTGCSQQGPARCDGNA